MKMCARGIAEPGIGIYVIRAWIATGTLLCVTACTARAATLRAPRETHTTSPPCQPVVRTFHAYTFREEGRTYAAMSRSHLGVDFVACTDEHVIAIADGRIMYVSREESDEYSGGGKNLSAFHLLSGEGKRIRWFTYAHLTNVRVAKGAWVRRGDVIGDLWRPPNPESGWKPHVHLQWDDDSVAIEHRDPLPMLDGCESGVTNDALIFPVRC